MSVKDEKLTDDVKRAYEYFTKLQVSVGPGEEVEVNDSEMVKVAAYAASVFGNSLALKEMVKEIENKSGRILSGAISTETSQSEVILMCKKYAKGRREFDRYAVENAKRLCEALILYVKVLEGKDSSQIISEVYSKRKTGV